MIDRAYLRLMARYNTWQNGSLYQAAAGLNDEMRHLDCGAYWGSIHGTLSHLLWADRLWLSRFSPEIAAPEGELSTSATCYNDWHDLYTTRQETDDFIMRWVEELAIEGELCWFSGVENREISKPRWQVLTHFFNHQTHHRGQVHALLTAAGTEPAATDIIFLPDNA